MATPTQANAGDGDKSQAAQRANKSIWIWVVLAVVVVAAVIGFMARAATGPGASKTPVESAQGAGTGQPGATPTFAPTPNHIMPRAQQEAEGYAQ